MNTLMRAEAVTRRLEGDVPVTLVDNASLEIREGEFMVITGPSGSGKSSLLYLLGLLDRPSSGQIILHQKTVSNLKEEELAAIRLVELGFVFQFHFLLPEFTAIENVMLPMKRLGKLTLAQTKARAEELLQKLGLGDQMHKTPKQLSGGQSQRVAIARALANDPTLILADEPTGNLDTGASENVEQILKEISRRPKKAVVVVTHDQTFAERADRVVTIVDGRIQ